MRIQFRCLQLEDVIDGIVADPSLSGSRREFSALDGMVSYKELIAAEPLDSNPSSLLGVDEFNRDIARIWRTIYERSQFQPSGSLELRNLVAFASRGLLLDLQHRYALIGGVFNWGVDYLRYYLDTSPRESGAALSKDQTSVELEVPDVIATEQRPGLMMLSPGQDIYGHWLLDYAPRLMLAGLMHGPAVARYYFDALPRWAGPVLTAFGVPPSAIEVGPRPHFLRYALAAMPTATKIGFRISRPVNRMAWLRLKHMLLAAPLTLEERNRLPREHHLFVSRRGWPSARTIANAERLEEIAMERGFAVVHPEEFSLAAQARIFRDARIVIGEDGSGLHNIMFSEPGALLGVISFRERVNFWHLSICQELGHRLCYIAATDRAGVNVVDESGYNRMIDLLADAAV